MEGRNQQVMGLITLQEYINRKGWLEWGMRVNADFGEMIVRGFVNSSKDMIDNTHFIRPTRPQLIGFVDKNCSNMVICSNYMYQIINWHNGEKTLQQGVVHPIYPAIHRYQNNTEVDLEQLYIPDLVTHPLYKAIRSKKEKNSFLTEQELHKYRPYKNESDRWKEHGIIINNGKAYMPVKNGDIVFHSLNGLLKPYTTDSSIKSIAQEILVVCRYLHEQTGQIHYALFGLDELTTDISQGDK